MNPRFIDDMSWAMGQVYAAVTDQILINMARHLAAFRQGATPGGGWDYQVKKLAELGQVSKESAQIIVNMLSGADDALAGLLEQCIMDSLKDADPALRKAAQKGLLQGEGFLPPEVSPSQMQAFKAYYAQSADKLNLVNTVMLESTEEAYRNTVADIASRINNTQEILNTETGKVVSGVSSLNDAVHRGVQRMVKNGITGYIDHAGRRWSPEAYVTMDVRTTMANTARAAVFERNAQYGNDLYQVSYHDGARPLCYPWQGKIISRDDLIRDVTDDEGNTVHVYAQSETTYGNAAGLFGVNCKHYPIPFVPGFSRIRTPPQNEEENAKEYEESQTQRALERDLRYQKRDLAVLKAEGASEEAIAAQKEKVRNASLRLDEFCDKTGRARRRSREYTPIRATFPDKTTYDPSQFPTDKRDAMRRFFGLTTPVVAQQATQTAQNTFTMDYGEPFDFEWRKYRKPQQKQFQSAKETLDNAPLITRKAWTKVADRLKHPEIDSSHAGAYYSPYTKRTHFHSYKKCFDEDEFQRKNTVFFHEYGHNIDDLLGKKGSFLSEDYKDNLLQRTVMTESENIATEFYKEYHNVETAIDAVMQYHDESAAGMGSRHYISQMLKAKLPQNEWRNIVSVLDDAGWDKTTVRSYAEKYINEEINNDFRALVHKRETGQQLRNKVKETYTPYERGDVSDMMERFFVQTYGIAFPFGFGHGSSYATNGNSTAHETFAEMYAATVTQSDSLKTIKDWFPESYKIFIEMLESVTND